MMHLISNKLHLLHADLVKDDYAEYMDSIKGKIGLLYSAFPQKRTFHYWRNLKGVVNRQSYSHQNVIEKLMQCVDYCRPQEVSIEVGVEDFNYVYNRLIHIYSHLTISSILYAAPTGNRMVRKQSTCPFIRASHDVIKEVNYDYSDDYLLNRAEYYDIKSVFDPCVGKGLIVDVFAKYSIPIYGIDFNINRLNTAIKSYENKTDLSPTLEVGRK